MSDNEDLLGDDLGDHSLADYNLGNEEEEQLLADDYETNSSQNVPASIGSNYGSGDISNDFSSHSMEYSAPQPQYQQIAETESVVPNITVEVPNTPIPDHSTYAPYEPPVYDPDHAVVPPAIPAAPLESPQIVPTDMPAIIANGADSGARERFPSERAPGSQRLPQVRDIPDSLDKVFIPRGGYSSSRGRTSWRNPQFQPRYNHPYRRNNVHRGNFNQRQSFPPQQMRPSPPQMRPEIRPEMHPDIRPEFRPEMRPNIRPEFRPEGHPDVRPDMRPDMRDMRPDMRDMRPDIRPDMRPDIRPDMRPDIRPDMRPDIRPDMRPDIRPDMRPDIRPDMRPDNRQDMRPDIRQDMRPDMRQDMRPDMRQDMRPDMRQDMRPDIRQDMRPDIHPDIRLDPMPQMPPQMGPEMSPERPMLPEMQFRPENRFGPNTPRPNFRPTMDERPFGPRPMFYPRPGFNPRPFGPPIREIVPNSASHMPQVTIRQPLPMAKMDKFPPGPKPNREQEVIMLPVQLPPNLPPGGLAGKKVLINPHFKGNFQPPGDGGLPTYIPTRIQKSPPLSPTLENKFAVRRPLLGKGPVKDIDDAAERFIAEQRNALARAANRKLPPRRSPQRYIENTTIEIENDMMARGRADNDLELLRRQEEFINANRAGLRRRMRSPSPTRPRSVSPRRSPERRHRPDRPERPERPDRPERPHDEDSEYRRRVREQETLRERVLRAKEQRRRKNAVALQKQLDERERQERTKDIPKPEESKEKDKLPDKPSSTEDTKPDTTRKSPEKIEKVVKEIKVEKVVKEEKVEKIRERSPVKEEKVEVNSTCEGLTPPREALESSNSPRALTPPLPGDSDDDLDLILGDIDGILSDDDEPKRPNRTESKPKPSTTTTTTTDLRSKLPAKNTPRPPRQKIVFHEAKEKTPPRRAVVTSSTKTESSEISEKKNSKAKSKSDASSNKNRPRITYDHKEQPEKDEDKKSFANRRVILQRKVTPKEKSVFSRIEIKTDPTKPNPGIFSRAVRTAIGSEKTRIVVKKEEPQVEYGDESSDEEKDEDVGMIASVSELPPGMTTARLRALAGSNVQNLSLDKEERSAKITFKTPAAAESFKKKFNNKMVAACRLIVTLH